MITWPDHALQAVWGLTQRRFRFVRSGGSFAKWKASRRSPEERMEQSLDKERREQNRAETADPRRRVFSGDRLLSKVMVKIRGVRIAALLFETAKNMDLEAAETSPPHAGRVYPSATISITQESRDKDDDASYSRVQRHAVTFWNGLRTRLSQFGMVVRSWSTKIGEFAQVALRRHL